MKDFFARTITGLIYAAAIIAAICIHPFGFLALFVFVVGFSLWEFYDMDKDNTGWRKYIGILGGMYLFTASFLYAGGFTPSYIFYPYIFFLIGILVSSLYHITSNPFKNCAMSFFGQFYCAGLISTLNFIVFNPYTNQYIPQYALLIFIFVWLNDTGAYLTGISFGRHRLFERVSPKKSWEGFWGGLFIAMIASLVIAYYFPTLISWQQSLGLAIVTSIFATFGDLVESLFKRSSGIKDSGMLLPGHGGILDRIDSIMLAAPATLLYIELFIRK
ncbi:MAG: phosphatidate cytidylyltransferase [Tannerella sp.]|nr:phosphatidate cytidylyltransferase [Tannerella sp.]